MPEKRQKPGKELPREDPDIVKLKPVFGIKPGYYLAAIYGAALLLILFLVLIYPGIKNPGVLVTVNSEPRGAAVYVDGVYRGAAPCEIFVKKGQRSIELSLSGFAPIKRKLDAGSRLFASALFPLKTGITGELSFLSPKEAFINEASEYAAWTFIGEPTITNQVPLCLSEAAYRLGPAASDPAVRKSMDDTLAASSRFAVTRAGLRDLIRAKILLDNKGLSPSPISLLASAGEMIAFLGRNQETAQWLSLSLQGEPASLVKSSSWYKSPGPDSPIILPKSRTTGTLQSYANLRFTEIEAAASPAYKFYIAETPLPSEAWELFLREKSEWRSENRDALMERGYVDSQYLASWDFPNIPLGAAVLISWYAAKAWCEWYSSKLPATSGLEARLPAENEWELAAGAGMGRTGDFWEWCLDPFTPLVFSASNFPGLEPLIASISPERSLKGGSWINAPGAVKKETRASLPPSLCSPFVSFRPVLVPKGSRP